MLLVLGIFAVAVIFYCIFRRWPQVRRRARHAASALQRLGMPSKVKQLVSFYQLATSVSSVYHVEMPSAAKAVFEVFAVSVSFGLNDIGVPMQCAGLYGYKARLVFWMMAPLVALLAIPLTTASARLIRYGWRRSSIQIDENRDAACGCEGLTYTCLPSCLKLLFLAYPFVSTVAFRAFDCMDFGQSGKWLRADYQVRCDDGGEYAEIQTLAILAIFLFPVGVPLVYAALLLSSRRAIHTEKPTQLSTALAFLHGDFRKEYFWWELVEVSRRFILVGVACVVSPGTLNQIFLGAASALVHLVVQMQARPFLRATEGFLSMASGFLLVVIFFCCILLQIDTLDEETELTSEGEVSLTERLPPELRERFSSSTALISAGLILSVLGALIIAIIILTYQRGEERRLARQDLVLRQMRRLRYHKTNQPVALNRVEDGHFHLFLSHCWAGGGQDAMRIVKQRLKEMIPEVRVFLEYALLGI